MNLKPKGLVKYNIAKILSMSWKIADEILDDYHGDLVKMWILKCTKTAIEGEVFVYGNLGSFSQFHI